MLLLAIVFVVIWLVSVFFAGQRWPEWGPYSAAVLVMLAILGWVTFAPVLAGR